VSTFAANPAGLPHVSPRTVERRANQNLPTRNDGGGRHPSCGGYTCSNRASIVANFRSQCASGNFALARICRYVSPLLLGYSFGAFPAPGGTRSSASHLAPLWGLASSRNKFENYDKERLSNFFRAPPRKQTIGTCGAGPTR